MAKRRAESQIAKFDFRPLKVGNRFDFLACKWHATMKATTLLQTSFQLKVWTLSYWLSKSRESQYWEFRNSNFGVPRQNDIWVLAPWPSTENTIRGKVVVFPKFRLWWVCEFVFVHGSSMHQKCSNYALTNLLFSLCRSVW